MDLGVDWEAQASSFLEARMGSALCLLYGRSLLSEQRIKRRQLKPVALLESHGLPD